MEETIQTKTSEKVVDQLFEDYRDMRLDYVNLTNLRNDIQLFEFQNKSGSFGAGGARVESVRLLDENKSPLSWIVGGERVILEISCKALTNLNGPIVGFYVKDRLGQNLFGDNTFITYMSNPVMVEEGVDFISEFNFRMPLLPAGDYSIAVAVAEGSQSEHVQHHWVHDALVFVSHASLVCQGLVGVPMSKIEINVLGI